MPAPMTKWTIQATALFERLMFEAAEPRMIAQYEDGEPILDEDGHRKLDHATDWDGNPQYLLTLRAKTVGAEKSEFIEVSVTAYGDTLPWQDWDDTTPVAIEDITIGASKRGALYFSTSSIRHAHALSAA